MSVSESAATGAPLSARDSYGRPRRAGYQVAIVLAWLGFVALIQYYLVHTSGAPVRAATQVGRLYGLVGTVLFLFLSLYGLRRIAYQSQAGSLELWYRAHLLLGLLALGLLGCHSGFSSHRPFLVLLQVAFWGTLLSGTLGWGYQTALKRWMVRHEYRPAVLSELEARARELSAELAPAAAESESASRLAACQVLAELARRRAGAFWPMQGWDYWDGQVVEALRGTSPEALDEAAHARLRELNRVEVLARQHRLLRGWTTLHLLFTVAAVQVVLWHVAMVAGNPR